MDIYHIINAIVPPDEAAMHRARARWESIAKPLKSMGLLEDVVIRMAGIFGAEQFRIDRRAVLVMCADNGIVQEGVTQTGQEVTAIVANNMARGAASVCHMGRIANADVFPVDIGMANSAADGVLHRRVRAGTANMAEGPAMTRQEAILAIETGIELATMLKEQGYALIATGEMGIGNTTTASAVTGVLLNLPAEQVTGRGAGLSDIALGRKVAAIKRAIARNAPDPNDALDVLHKVGGLDIAGLVGVFLGGAYCRIPVLVDGFISSAAALCAQRLCPSAAQYMLASHLSKEPAARMLLNELGLRPSIDAGLSLGEGTGALAFMPLLDMALAIYNEMPTFREIDITPYTPQEVS